MYDKVVHSMDNGSYLVQCIIQGFDDLTVKD